MTLLQPTDVPSRTGINNAITSEIANHASLTDVNSLHYDSGWLAIPLRAGFSAGTEAPEVRRVGKMVYLRGRINGSIAANVPVSVADVPAGFRPAVAVIFGASGTDNNVAGRFLINNSGAVVYTLTLAKTTGVSCASSYLID